MVSNRDFVNLTVTVCDTAVIFRLISFVLILQDQHFPPIRWLFGFTRAS